MIFDRYHLHNLIKSGSVIEMKIFFARKAWEQLREKITQDKTRQDITIPTLGE